MTNKCKLLLGCCEESVVEFIRVLLAAPCEVSERSSCADLLHAAGSGGFNAVIVYGNCLTPPYVCEGGLVENTRLAIQKIKAAQGVSLIALTSMPEWRETTPSHRGRCLSGHSFSCRRVQGRGIQLFTSPSLRESPGCRARAGFGKRQYLNTHSLALTILI